ncbi:hypothetical protein LZ30DRAFT_188820 [Colletotrichum cereale]|nr:hypothetical protein LZ30DRAFT_188820 [Colletotrichum cereale]
MGRVGVQRQGNKMAKVRGWGRTRRDDGIEEAEMPGWRVGGGGGWMMRRKAHKHRRENSLIGARELFPDVPMSRWLRMFRSDQGGASTCRGSDAAGAEWRPRCRCRAAWWRGGSGWWSMFAGEIGVRGFSATSPDIFPVSPLDLPRYLLNSSPPSQAFSG